MAKIQGPVIRLIDTDTGLFTDKRELAEYAAWNTALREFDAEVNKAVNRPACCKDNSCGRGAFYGKIAKYDICNCLAQDTCLFPKACFGEILANQILLYKI